MIVKNYLYYCLFLTTLVIACGKKENYDLKIPQEIPAPVDTAIPIITKPDTAIIVVIGSSTAAGWGASVPDSSWVNRLKVSTPAKYYNLAYGGYTTYQGLPNGFVVTGRPAADTIKNVTRALIFHPTLVIMSYPTNDVANDYPDEDILNNFNAMVHVLDSAKVNYILCGTQPRNFTDWMHRERLRTLNEKMKVVYGARFNNLYDTLAASDLTIKEELSYKDGVHVNDAGHRIIYEKVLQHAMFRAVVKL